MQNRIHAFYKQVQSEAYHTQIKRVVLVANISSSFYLDDLYWETLHAYTQKWAKKYGSGWSRLNIIYLSENDTCDSEKFRCLSTLQAGDQIDIIGHHYPGRDDIESDEKINLITHQTITSRFSYTWLSDILIHHIKPTVLSPQTNDALPLLINLLACETAKPQMNFFKTKILNPSIAEKMAAYWMEKGFYNVVIRGRLFEITPVPTAKNKFASFAWQYLTNPARALSTACKEEAGFHVRDSISFLFFRTYPAVTRNKPYKVDHFIENNEIVKINRIKK